MASENINNSRTGPNLQQGAGIFAKRFQKSLNRAQEKVLQKLGKTMETKDEQFEQCFLNLNKQQVDGSKLHKDVRAYFNAVKAMHESSKRLSETLRDVYESDWNGGEDLSVIMESEDLLWNDYEEKLTDQIVRTMENYTSQFPEVKERVAKRGRKLVDYDSARHHLEALQSAKKKDDAKTVKAEEEFNKAQNVFEEINNELREELPVLYQSRIGCYVTVFQNISNLRDVFYKEMSVLNHELYNIMKKLETQHSGKAFIIKGLNSSASKSKNRKSLVISNPIPCNTAFPADHISVHSSTDTSGPSAPRSHTEDISEEPGLPEQQDAASATDVPAKDVPAKDVTTSDSDQEELSSGGADTPKSQSVCDIESGDRSTGSQNPEDAEEETTTIHSDDSGVGDPRSEGTNQEVIGPSESEECDVPPSLEQQESAGDPPPQKAKSTKPPPVPAPRLSSRPSERRLIPAAAEASQVEEKEETAAEDQRMSNCDDSLQNPPGFLYKGVAQQNQAASEDGLLQFEEGDVILVLEDTHEQEGLVTGLREESWKQHRDVKNHCGVLMEKLIQPLHQD